MSHINIEIKAKLKNPNLILKILKNQRAQFIGTDHQIDTYFKVPYGRLKLREGNIENYLIFYKRNNKKGPKQSKVTLFEVVKDSPIKKILLDSLGSLIIVDKKRKIYFIDNVKFHVDVVRGLGSFVEIEAIDKMGNIGEKKLLQQCNKYLKLLNISKNDLLSNSYSDLLMK